MPSYMTMSFAPSMPKDLAKYEPVITMALKRAPLKFVSEEHRLHQLSILREQGDAVRADIRAALMWTGAQTKNPLPIGDLNYVAEATYQRMLKTLGGQSSES